MIKICVSGSKGKMGSKIIELVKDDAELEVAAQFDIDGDADASISSADCLVEFTSPKATIEHLELCLKNKKAMVIGTTGLSDAEKSRIEDASKKIPILFSPNMSVGVNLLFKIVKDAAATLGKDYSVEIVEAHHEHKKDSPSGTAKEIERIISGQRGAGRIPIESIREGEIVGEHTVTFESDGDVIEITHSAKKRDILAGGALRAAKWLVGKKPGLYTMKDVLGL